MEGCMEEVSPVKRAERTSRAKAQDHRPARHVGEDRRHEAVPASSRAGLRHGGQDFLEGPFK